MSYVTYTLPPIQNNPAGTMKVDLLINSSAEWASSLTVPSTVKVVSIGEVQELIDVDPGVVDVQNVQVELAEDYSVYPEGFWYRVIEYDQSVDIHFRFILTENGTDTYFFRGMVYRPETDFTEHYAIDGVKIVRTVKVKLVSPIILMKQTDLSLVLFSLLPSYYVSADTYPMSWGTKNFIKLRDIIACLAAESFVLAYDSSIPQFRNDEFQLIDDTLGSPVGPEDAYIVQNVDGTRGYLFGSSTDQNENPHYWLYQYGSCYDLLKAICLEFGWVCRYYEGLADGSWDAVTPSNNIPHLEFVTRGTSFASFISPEKGISSSVIHSEHVAKKQSFNVSDVQDVDGTYASGSKTDGTTGASWSNNYGAYQLHSGQLQYVSDVKFSIKPNPSEKFDLSVVLPFVLGSQSPFYQPYAAYRFLWFIAAGTATPFTKLNWYNRGTDGWVEEDTSLQNAVLYYYTNRFSPGRKCFERQYGSLKWTDGGTTTQANLKPMKRIAINDMLGTSTYYATEVRKDFQNNTSTVLWIEE